jgi:hypothetical protein
VSESGLDRSAMLDRLGEVDQPPPEVHSWLSRASFAARLPTVLELDQQSSFALCAEVVRHLRPTRRKP